MTVSQIHPFLRLNTHTIIPFLDRIIDKSPTDTASSRAFAAGSSLPSTSAFSSSNPGSFTRIDQFISPQIINVLPAPSTPNTSAPIIINNVGGSSSNSTSSAAKSKSKEELEAERKKTEEEKKKVEDKNAFIIGTVASLFSTFAMGYLWGTYAKAKDNYEQSYDLETRAHIEFNTEDPTQDIFMGLFRALSKDQRKIDESIYHTNSRLLGSTTGIFAGGALTFVSSFINTSGVLRTSARVAGYFSLLAGTGVGLFTFGLWLSSATDKVKLAQMAANAQQIKDHIQTPGYNQPNAFTPEQSFYESPPDTCLGVGFVPSAPPLPTYTFPSVTPNEEWVNSNFSTNDPAPEYTE